jgi:stress-induced morphogen
MTLTAAAIEKVIRTGIPGAAVRVEDVRGDGAYYAATVCSGAFVGRTLLEQHRLVYQALAEMLTDGQHFVQVKTLTQQ